MLATSVIEWPCNRLRSSRLIPIDPASVLNVRCFCHSRICGLIYRWNLLCAVDFDLCVEITSQGAVSHHAPDQEVRYVIQFAERYEVP